MDKEKIKNDLISTMESFIVQSNSFDGKEGIIEKLEMWQTKLRGVKGFSDLILEKLNEILENENVEFASDFEKEEFIEYIKPYVQELIVRQIKN